MMRVCCTSCVVLTCCLPCAESLTRLDTRQLPEIEEVFSIPKQVADRMLFFGRVRLRDKNRLARSCGRGPTVDPGHTYGMDDKHGDGTQHDASSSGPATRSPERGHELGSPPSALGSDRAAQDALAQAVGGVNEKTRAIAGALGLIGTEDRVYAKGGICCARVPSARLVVRCFSRSTLPTLRCAQAYSVTCSPAALVWPACAPSRIHS